MSGLFGGCGCNHGCDGHGGNFFGKLGCGEGLDCCTIILILLLLTGCLGCDIDWCTIIVIYLLFSCCGMFGGKDKCC